jgi:predicted house-cleaning noncanonical NTP pyrophosphatase (MazG superfamily)
MEKKLIKKMILNCFKQYYEAGPVPLNEKDMENLIEEILRDKEEEPCTDLYEVINDRVYEFLSS